MKYILLTAATLFIAVGCANNTEVIQYRQVSVTPVIEPGFIYQYDQGPIDVTSTTIDFY